MSDKELLTKDELSMTRRLLGAANVRVQHYEKVLRELAKGPPGHIPNDEVAGWTMDLAQEALEMDTPVEEQHS